MGSINRTEVKIKAELLDSENIKVNLMEENGECKNAGDSEQMFNLPAELIQHIVSFLSLSDICRLGATCHAGYAVTHDERFWNLHLTKEYKVRYFSSLTDLDDSSDDRNIDNRKVAGIVHDPTLQGNREMSVIY